MGKTNFMPKTVETTDLLLEDDGPLMGEVADEGRSGDAPAKPDKPAEPTADLLKELKAELKAERQARVQAERTAQFWGEKAQTAAKPAAAAEPEPEPTLSVDLVDALTNGDAKAIKRGLRDLGFVSEAEVNERIQQTRSQITQETQLITRYPFLGAGQEQTPEFQRASEIYRELAADPHMAKSPKLLETAARMAAAELGQADTRETRRRPVVEIDDEDEQEADRVARVSRQAGDRGRARTNHDPEAEELDSMQRSIVARFRAAGADIDDTKYAARARAGIRMGGMPTVRRGRR
jgi:hypothetical protein